MGGDFLEEAAGGGERICCIKVRRGDSKRSKFNNFSAPINSRPNSVRSLRIDRSNDEFIYRGRHVWNVESDEARDVTARVQRHRHDPDLSSVESRWIISRFPSVFREAAQTGSSSSSPSHYRSFHMTVARCQLSHRFILRPTENARVHVPHISEFSGEL